MSLINQVLKDLESRKQGAVSANAAEHVRPIFNHGEEKSHKKLWLTTGLVVGMSFFSVSGWFLYQTLETSPQDTKVYADTQVDRLLAAETPNTFSLPALPQAPFVFDESSELERHSASSEAQDEPNPEPMTRLGEQTLASIEPALAAPVESLAKQVPSALEVPASSPSMVKEAKTPEIRAKALFKKGKGLLKRGQLPEAMALFEESLSVWPLHHEARETMIWVHMRYRMWLHAEEKLTQAIALFPNETRYVILKARLLIEQKQPEVALSVLSSQTPALVESTEFYALKAALLQELERPTEAAELYQALTAFNPRQGAWQMGLGLALEQTGRYAAAINAYEAALGTSALSPESEQYVKKRVRVLQAS